MSMVPPDVVPTSSSVAELCTSLAAPECSFHNVAVCMFGLFLLLLTLFPPVFLNNHKADLLSWVQGLVEPMLQAAQLPFTFKCATISAIGAFISYTIWAVYFCRSKCKCGLCCPNPAMDLGCGNHHQNPDFSRIGFYYYFFFLIYFTESAK